MNQNHAKQEEYLLKFKEWVELRTKNDDFPIIGDHIDRRQIVAHVGCHRNWLSQHPHPAKILSELDKSIGGRVCAARLPSKSDPHLQLMTQKIKRLESRVLQQQTEISDMRQKLAEAAWCEHFDEHQDGALPW